MSWTVRYLDKPQRRDVNTLTAILPVMQYIKHRYIAINKYNSDGDGYGDGYGEEINIFWLTKYFSFVVIFAVALAVG